MPRLRQWTIKRKQIPSEHMAKSPEWHLNTHSKPWKCDKSDKVTLLTLCNTCTDNEIPKRKKVGHFSESDECYYCGALINIKFQAAEMSSTVNSIFCSFSCV